LSVNRMLPIVLAHGLGNFISAFSILAFTTTQGFQGDTMLPFLLTYYGPMLIAGAVLAIVFHRFIKRAFFASKRLMGALKHRTVPGDALIMLVMFIILVLLSYFLIF
nr:hypothetical protein [Candidatus Sigynarchaeota archaeon]